MSLLNRRSSDFQNLSELQNKEGIMQRKLYLRYMGALEREIISNSAKDRVKFPMAIVLDANDNTAEL